MSNAKEYVFGNNLKKARERMGLTQQGLTALTGVTNIAHYETGMRLPSFEVLTDLCVKMKLSADTLVFGEQTENVDVQNRAMAFNRIKSIVDKVALSHERSLRNPS